MAPTQGSVRRLKAPGNESGETSGFLLQLIKPLEMIDAVFDVLSNAKHHCAGGSHSQTDGRSDGR